MGGIVNEKKGKAESLDWDHFANPDSDGFVCETRDRKRHDPRSCPGDLVGLRDLAFGYRI